MSSRTLAAATCTLLAIGGGLTAASTASAVPPAPASSAAISATGSTAPAKRISAAAVAKHRTASDCWTIVGRSVYDLTAYIPRHPGGTARIVAVCGRNGTSAFGAEHGGSAEIATMLAQYRIGRLAR